MGDRMARWRPLEPDSPRQDAPVKFRQRHIHRQIARRQPGTGVPPVILQRG